MARSEYEETRVLPVYEDPQAVLLYGHTLAVMNRFRDLLAQRGITYTEPLRNAYLITAQRTDLGELISFIRGNWGPAKPASPRHGAEHPQSERRGPHPRHC